MPVRAWLADFAAREAGRASAEGAGHGSRSSLTPPSDAEEPPAASGRGSSGADDFGPTFGVGWGPSRDGFGRRGSAPDPAPTAEATRASAAAILALALDEAGATDPSSAAGIPGARDFPAALGVRARLRPLEKGEIEQLLTAPAAQTDAHAPLREVEQALRVIREQLDAGDERPAPPAAQPAPSPLAVSRAAEPEQASADAIAQLGLDIGRLVDVMDCRFDRFEAVSARHTVDLRSEVVQMFDELAARVEAVEQRSAAPGVEVAADPAPAPASVPPHDAVSASPGWPEVPFAGEPSEGARAADDVDGEAVEDPVSGPAPDPVEPWAGAEPGRGAEIELGSQWPAADPFDPDADLFDEPPRRAGAASGARLDAKAAPVDPFAWSNAPAPAAESEDGGPDASADAEGAPLDPFAAPAEAVRPEGDLASEDHGKRPGFGWLSFRRRPPGAGRAAG